MPAQVIALTELADRRDLRRWAQARHDAAVWTADSVHAAAIATATDELAEALAAIDAGTEVPG